MKKDIQKIVIIVLAVAPTFAFAALDGVKGLIGDVKDILNLLEPVIFALALFFFFWGIIQFIRNEAGSDKTRAEGQRKILWGIIALFVMFSIWGILNFVGGLVGISPGVGNDPALQSGCNNCLPTDTQINP
jgi:hypothetical protein